MSFFNIVSLLGGLATFLFGMNILSSGLEKLSGGRLEKTLEKFTDKFYKGILLGALVTGVIQSSSATTVIVVGLVNAGILKLKQAIYVIMGANIGTTVTAQILRLSDISGDNFLLSLVKPTTLAPMVAVVGILLFMTSKKNKHKNVGQIFLGFSVLFTGMFAMEGAVSVLKDVPEFTQIFATLSNPILGVVVGALVTAIIQSSSASVGILQALSSTGGITYSAAFPIIMGQNIGTCVTSLLSSIGANKNARRAAMVHLYFNVIGTIVFFVFTYTFQHFIGFSFWDQPIDRGGIANFHLVFNIATTFLLLPFASLLEKLAKLTIRDKDGDGPVSQTSNLDERFLVSPGLALVQARNTLAVMMDHAKDNFAKSVTLFSKYDRKLVARIEEHENTIDIMEDRTGNYLLKLGDKELSDEESRSVTEYLHMISEVERIGDYSINITESAGILYEDDVSLSDQAKLELNAIADAVSEIIELSQRAFVENDAKLALDVEPLEETIDDMVDMLKTRHIIRLKDGTCQVEAGVHFLETLANLERIADHCSNIAIYLIGYVSKAGQINRHEYIENVHQGKTGEYVAKFEQYRDKYLSRIAG
ncbi:Na/Pi cotransporter family protein [Candidatus Soleaferrea massiliensis]|uniref:Na/Pi cotransporter family protein n=1 Tax=Candidatus Soleaferrea massiliensis TaxID=1470354 RepID=UPI00058CA4A9|nr:Na/Pi cotransporter family protein [Candidatus Soleaferrea massiliensis]